MSPKTRLEIDKVRGIVRVYLIATGELLYTLNVVTPRLSMVCVTNRPEFSEAVWAQYRGQDWPNKELVVIDACEGGSSLKDRADVYVPMPTDTWVGPLRNAGVKAARGDWIMWFDDDDWRHPALASILMTTALDTDSCISGLNAYYWIDLDGKMCRRSCGNWPVFGAAVYRNFHDFPPFREKPRCKTDSYWLPRMQERGKMTLSGNADLFVYVHHKTNVHNTDLGMKRVASEMDDRFFPDEHFGLPAHMEKIRAGVTA